MSASTETLKGIFRSLVAIILAGGTYLAAYFSLDVRWWIDIQDVAVVENGTRVVVGREINQNFSGSYIVTIRNTDGRAVCTTNKQQVEYDTSAVLPDPVTLQYWAYGGACTEVLKSPLPDGDYTMTTCHRVLQPLGIFPPIQRCVSTVFQVPEAKR